MAAIVPCPRCDREMDATLVVCWPCYRATNRLQEDPGIEGFAHYVKIWDAARLVRNPEYRPRTEDTGIFICENHDE